jgi:hypothetical protein
VSQKVFRNILQQVAALRQYTLADAAGFVKNPLDSSSMMAAVSPIALVWEKSRPMKMCGKRSRRRWGEPV